MIERWKPIKGYEGMYEVSDQGRVKSLQRMVHHWQGGERRIRMRYLRPCLSGAYATVSLSKSNEIVTKQIHRLVAEAFLPNPDNSPIVNHKDENKKNNVVQNLEWCTYSYNNSYGNAHRNRAFDYTALAKKLSKRCVQYDKDGEIVRIWESVESAGRAGYGCSQISKCANGHLKTHKGYTWRYA